MQVEWSTRALKDLERLPPQLRQRITEAIGHFAETRAGDIETIKGEKDAYRLRVGEWRVVFRWDKKTDTIHIRRARPRGGAYRP